jgi:hypothetical protein
VKISVASIALPIVLGAIALMQPARVEAQSLYRLWDDSIRIAPASGQTALPSYLLRFGIFINNFTPTVANFSEWDANFRGGTGAIDGLQGGPVLNVYAAEFSASNNSLYPAGSQLYLVAYNVAPNASVSTATHGVILTRSDWILSGPSTNIRNGRVIGWFNYYYEAGGTRISAGDLSEDNPGYITSVSAFSSPINSFSLGTGGGFAGVGGGVVQTSFDMVPEPSAVSLLAVGLGGLAMMRRRRQAD